MRFQLEKKTLTLNQAIYRLHQFWLPTLLVVGITGPFVLSLLFSILMMPVFYLSDTSIGSIWELVGILLVVLFIVLVIIGIDALILFSIFNSWKKQDYIQSVINNAKMLGIYDDNYISDIEEDLKNGLNYCATYFALSEKYVFGILLNHANTYVPVVIPKNRIKGIAYDLEHYNSLIAGNGLHIAKFYIGGYNVYLDNDKRIVFQYGYKFGINKTIKAIKDCGLDVWQK